HSLDCEQSLKVGSLLLNRHILWPNRQNKSPRATESPRTVQALFFISELLKHLVRDIFIDFPCWVVCQVNRRSEVFFIPVRLTHWNLPKQRCLQFFSKLWSAALSE